MLKFHFFGCASGCAPDEGWHHTSFAVECASGLYWFDAGETCSYTAHNMGIDLLSVKKIFISHTHMDHIGGLGNLFWNIRKVGIVRNKKPANAEIELFIPRSEAWEGLRQMLTYTEGDFKCDFEVVPSAVNDGLLYGCDDISVYALHNHHLPHEPGESYHSFGFIIKSGDKRIAYTGDTRDIDDMESFLSEKTDILLAETGHHSPLAICDRLLCSENAPGEIWFIHSGTAIRHNDDNVIERLNELYGSRVKIIKEKETHTV